MLEGRLTGRRMVDGDYEGEPGHREITLTDEEYFWEPVPGCGMQRLCGKTKIGRYKTAC